MKVAIELTGNQVKNIVADGDLELYIVEEGTPEQERVFITQYEVTVEPTDAAYLDELAQAWKQGREELQH